MQTLLRPIINGRKDYLRDCRRVKILRLDPLEKFRLYNETGAAAVDMESDIAAKIAGESRIPFAACRVIIDAAHRTLPPAATVGLRPNGTSDVLATFLSVWQNPSQLPDLLRTAFDARITQRALRLGRKQLGEGLGFPYCISSDLERPALGLATESDSLNDVILEAKPKRRCRPTRKRRRLSYVMS